MTTTTSLPLTGAFAIFHQLGGNRFCAMTGAKSFVYGNEPVSLQFSIGRNPMRVGKVVVTLQDDDTYTVAFYAARSWTPRKVLFGVYADGLRQAFEVNTGLLTSL